MSLKQTAHPRIPRHCNKGVLLREQTTKRHDERMARLRRMQQENVPRAAVGKGKSSGDVEAEGVAGYQLANVMRAWIDQWRRERPFEPRDYTTSDGQNFMSAPAYLAFHSGLPERRIRLYASGTQAFVSLSYVEKILMAMGKEHYLSNDELDVIPNPYWSQEFYIEWMSQRGCV